ncbi:MAG: hypothetical protein RLZZ373_1208 [Pseudomonadota bacterium]
MPKILLVEDNEMNREMLSRRLVRKGFEVVMAVDGLQGVAMARQEQPDLVLMDMSLPGIDGWEATRRIKADVATQAVPVIALTAHAMSGDRAEALAAGCDEFDTKPVDLPRLLDKIDRLLTTSDTTLPAVAASLHAWKAALDALCRRAGVSDAVRADLQVVLDEACANVVKHAYPPGQPGALRLTLRHLPAAIEITLTDQGRPFNPLAQPTPDLSLSWEDRPLGGLGIHLIRQMTDHQSYRHTDAEGNRLSLVKDLT